jgi:CRISPR-associated protein Cas5d
MTLKGGYLLENSKTKYDVAVKLWGDIACFTRPEFKVDRVTYPVMTPSAARGVLEAIFWKPEIRWEIREIWILNPINEISVLRNEISERQNTQERELFFIENDGKRQQRTSLFLKKPKYLVLADVRLKETTKDCKKKYLEQFERRLIRGECYHQPYFGTRECTAFFEKANGDECPILENMSIGNMLFDIAYCKDEKRYDFEFVERHDNQPHVVKGYTQPLFFPSRLANGVMSIPANKYEELYRLEGLHVK